MSVAFVVVTDHDKHLSVDQPQLSASVCSSSINFTDSVILSSLVLCRFVAWP